eukprot:gene9536-3045_t
MHSKTDFSLTDYLISWSIDLNDDLQLKANGLGAVASSPARIQLGTSISWNEFIKPRNRLMNSFEEWAFPTGFELEMKLLHPVPPSAALCLDRFPIKYTELLRYFLRHRKVCPVNLAAKAKPRPVKPKPTPNPTPLSPTTFNQNILEKIKLSIGEKLAQEKGEVKAEEKEEEDKDH